MTATFLFIGGDSDGKKVGIPTKQNGTPTMAVVKAFTKKGVGIQEYQRQWRDGVWVFVFVQPPKS